MEGSGINKEWINLSPFVGLEITDPADNGDVLAELAERYMSETKLLAGQVHILMAAQKRQQPVCCSRYRDLRSSFKKHREAPQFRT